MTSRVTGSMLAARPLLTAAVLVLLAACMPLGSPEPPPVRYLLTGPEADVVVREALAELPGLAAPLALARPAVPAGLDGDGIGVIREQRRLDYVAGARWAEPLPELLRRSLSRSLETALGIPVAAAGTAPHRLAVRVERFHPVYGAAVSEAPELEVALVVTLLDARSGAALATGQGKRASRASENRLGAIIVELDGLLHEAFMEALAVLDRELGKDGRRAQCDHGACNPLSTSR